MFHEVFNSYFLQAALSFSVHFILLYASVLFLLYETHVHENTL